MERLAEELVVRGGPVVDGPALLGERAAFAGLTARGATAPGGSCRFVRGADGWLAVSLPRASDVALANAWLDDARLDPDDPWSRLADVLATEPVAAATARAAELGLAVSRLGEVDDPAAMFPAPMFDAIPARVAQHAPFVVDLSSLWAGPLCAQLLGLAGARVVKVESVERPDAGRQGANAFFDLLHHGHGSVALPFGTRRGRDALRALVDAADVVIEASRPRALEQLGIDAAGHVARGAVWISVTAYGRFAAPMRVGFGDDVGVAAGVHAGTSDAPVFCADAVADPVTGLYAAVAALAALETGRGALVDVAMASVARLARGGHRAVERVAERRVGGWYLDGMEVARPHGRTPLGPAPALGADTATVMTDIGVRRWD
jgi:crotonobetainyl-CoA:carnitine CoA-transferase CaiB-like acyl-CoA transferase